MSLLKLFKKNEIFNLVKTTGLIVFTTQFKSRGIEKSIENGWKIIAILYQFLTMKYIEKL